MSIEVCRTSSKLMLVTLGLACFSSSPTKIPMCVPVRIGPAQLSALAPHASTTLPNFAHSGSRLSLAEVLELGSSSVLPSASLVSRSLNGHGSVCFVATGYQLRCRTSPNLMSVIVGLECSSRSPTKIPMYVPLRIWPPQLSALAQHASTTLPDFAHSDLNSTLIRF